MKKGEKYLAHKTEDREQTVLEHLKGTAKLSKRFALSFGKSRQGEMAGYLHDIGKYSEEFQKRIRNPELTRKCDHSTAGATEAFKQHQLEVAICIMGHHGGLQDLGGSMDTSEDGTVQGRLKRGLDGEIPDYSVWKEECDLCEFSYVPKMDSSQLEFSRYLETKMLYSSLVDADYLDTEVFMEEGALPRGEYDTLGQLKERLELYLKKKNWLSTKEGINGIRTEFLEMAAIQGENQEKGIYTLTIPTGGGKTISSLRFALHHAVAQGQERIIYVVPYLNIIEQTAETFREILGSRNVLEHHSNVMYEEAGEEHLRLHLASENWDMPVIITTMVQFFESLFHNKPSRCRKLHNITNSVIIYDEIQMLPVNYWIPCVCMLEELLKIGNTTQVLCTATQPAIKFSEEIKVKEITKNTKRYFEELKRVSFRDIRQQGLEEICDRIKRKEQVLCIVNTKRTAKKLYDLLAGTEGIFHLTTMMIPVHRKEVLLSIRERLRQGYICKVVATSLVEAGVDLDFKNVMREQAGLDSILQAAGRCNRNGVRNPEESVVEVFTLEGKVQNSIRQQTDAFCYIMDKYEKWDSPDAIEEYFKFWRKLRGKENLDRKNIMEKVKRYAFREIAEAFRLIENDTYTIYVPWKEEGEKLVSRLRSGHYDRTLMRKLGRYGVNVFETHYKKLFQFGDIELVDGIAVLTNMNLYNENTGLEFQTEEGIALFC